MRLCMQAKRGVIENPAAINHINYAPFRSGSALPYHSTPVHLIYASFLTDCEVSSRSKFLGQYFFSCDFLCSLEFPLMQSFHTERKMYLYAALLSGHVQSGQKSSLIQGIYFL